MILGFERTKNLFFQRQKLRGTALFFFGIFLVMMKWYFVCYKRLLFFQISPDSPYLFCRPKVGIFVEIFGFMNLFGNFIPHIIVVANHMPVIGKILEVPGIKQVYILSISFSIPFTLL